MSKKSIYSQMLAKMNNCHSIGIICSMLTVLQFEYDAAIAYNRYQKAHFILELINEEINS